MEIANTPAKTDFICAPRTSHVGDLPIDRREIALGQQLIHFRKTAATQKLLRRQRRRMRALDDTLVCALDERLFLLCRLAPQQEHHPRGRASTNSMIRLVQRLPTTRLGAAVARTAESRAAWGESYVRPVWTTSSWFSPDVTPSCWFAMIWCVLNGGMLMPSARLFGGISDGSHRGRMPPQRRTPCASRPG